MSKRILAIILLISAIIIAVPFTVSASNDTTVNGANVNVGDIIVYKLAVDEADKIALGLQFEVNYDNKILETISAECVNLSSYVINPYNEKSKVMVNASSLEGFDFTNGKEILIVNFEVIGKGNTKITEKFDCFYDINFDDIVFKCSHELSKNGVILDEKEIETIPSTPIKTTISVPVITETFANTTETMPIKTTEKIETTIQNITTKHPVITTVVPTKPTEITTSMVTTDPIETTNYPAFSTPITENNTTIHVTNTAPNSSTIKSADPIETNNNINTESINTIVTEPSECSSEVIIPATSYVSDTNYSENTAYTEDEITDFFTISCTYATETNTSETSLDNGNITEIDVVKTGDSIKPIVSSTILLGLLFAFMSCFAFKRIS